jgi:hypothetical protein
MRGDWKGKGREREDWKGGLEGGYYEGGDGRMIRGSEDKGIGREKRRLEGREERCMGERLEGQQRNTEC